MALTLQYFVGKKYLHRRKGAPPHRIPALYALVLTQSASRTYAPYDVMDLKQNNMLESL